MRYLRFRRQLDEVHAATPVSEVVYEEVRRHRGHRRRARLWRAAGAAPGVCARSAASPTRGSPSGAIKKSLTGRGNADKADMVAAVNRLGFDVHDDNEADAIALFLLRMS